MLELFGGLAQSNPKVVPSGAILEPSGGMLSHVLAMLGPFGGHGAPKLAQVEPCWSHFDPFWEPVEIILGCFFDDRISMCLYTLFAQLLAPFLMGPRRARSSGLEWQRIFAFSEMSLILNDLWSIWE